MNRRKSRETVMKLMYQMSINKEELMDVIENLKENIEVDEEKMNEPSLIEREKDPDSMDLKDVDMEYIIRIAKGVKENQELLDSKIESNLINWKVYRLSKIDLTILRICVFEMQFEEETPERVAVNEAIELAKKFSSEKSAAFINGVLDKLMDKTIQS
jgi:transcription antitermination protein NusB